MQTLSYMQRSLTYQDGINLFFVLLLYIVYESMTTLYLILPPLFTILFFYFRKASEDENYILLSFVTIMLLFFEADNGYMLFSSIIYFTMLTRYVMPSLAIVITCEVCLKMLMVFLVYLGFYFFSLINSYLFFTAIPNMDIYIIYYMVIEFIIVSLL